MDVSATGCAGNALLGRSRTFIFAICALTLLLTSCGGQDTTSSVIVPDAADTGALLAKTDGGFLYGGRTTGDVWAIDADGNRGALPVVHVDVSSDGQRGLLGLALDQSGTLFLAWTDNSSTKTLTVAKVVGDSPKVIWDGPPSADVANGGHLAFAPSGALTIGIGDLTDIEAARSFDTVNGKMLSLDPNGEVDQKPTAISSGWHNPFAFTYRSDGTLWVADNSPANEERLARGDVNGEPTNITLISAHSAPSGLTERPNGELFVCSYVSNKLQGYDMRHANDSGAVEQGGPVAKDCATGVITLTDGSLVYAANDAIKRIEPE